MDRSEVDEGIATGIDGSAGYWSTKAGRQTSSVSGRIWRREARRIVEAWRIDCNTVRPHGRLGRLPSARPRVLRQGGPALGWQGRREDAVHRAGHPRGNDYCQSFNPNQGRAAQGEMFTTFREARPLSRIGAGATTLSGTLVARFSTTRTGAVLPHAPGVPYASVSPEL